MALIDTLVSSRLASRIWQRDTTAFAPADADPRVHDAIRDRLGWLDAPSRPPVPSEELVAWAADVHDEGLSHICLLGMGGSSLCPEVLHRILDPDAGAGRFLMLDTTDERAVRAAARALDPRHTLFVVASKSGTTIEVLSLERHFRAWTAAALGKASAGAHFVAITDPGTPLVDHAARHGYRRVFVNPPDIGGRYSALSLFGLVPAALMELPLDRRLLAPAVDLAAACRVDHKANPGLALGAFMAASALAGRDKLTLILPLALRPLGAWIEQLVAESTGKQGRGILPIVDEPIGPVQAYGPDRAFVAVSIGEEDGMAWHAEELARQGREVFQINAGIPDLGAEFFRWEFATAVAGAALGVNPFDEPDVRSAKSRTQALLETLERTGALPIEPPLARGRRWPFRAHQSSAAGPGRYVAILDYLPGDDQRGAAVARARDRIRLASRLATTHGTGPRYLHSTGQCHKGGPAGGLFVMLTAADAAATPIAESNFSFSALKQAQALGDFEALVAADRSVVHIHIDDPAADFSKALSELFDIRSADVWRELVGRV